VKKSQKEMKTDYNLQLVRYENKENVEDPSLAIENQPDDTHIINYDIKEIAIPENKSRQFLIII
jgi:hypothetical protein